MLSHEECAFLRQALGKYKKSAGLEIDPVLEAQAEGIYGEGMEFFGRGQLPPALAKFQVRRPPRLGPSWWY